MTLQSYYNRFDKSKKYDRTLFLAGHGLQSAELNEIQENALQKLKNVGDAIFGDGDVVEGTAIVDGELTLPIATDIAETGRESDAFTLSYELEPVLKQLLRTTDMKVNPYQAFEPAPAKVTLNLAVDRWTEVNTSWSSPITRRFSQFNQPANTHQHCWKRQPLCRAITHDQQCVAARTTL